MADAQESQPDGTMQSPFHDLDVALYEPKLEIPPFTHNATVIDKFPTYAIVSIPNTQQYAILKPYPTPNRGPFDQLRSGVTLANAIFYTVLGYDANLHKLRLICCGGTPVEHPVNSWQYLIQTNNNVAISELGNIAQAHLEECSECSGPDQLCATGRQWQTLFEIIDKSPRLQKLGAAEGYEAPEAFRRRRNQPKTDESREDASPRQHAKPINIENATSGSPTGGNALSLVLVWLSRFAGVLTFAHAAILLVLAVLEALDVKVGVLVYAQLFEATMAVEFLVELRTGESTLVYPITLAIDIFLRVVILIASLLSGASIGIGDIIACALFVAGYAVLIAVHGLRHYALSLVNSKNGTQPSNVHKRRDSSNHNSNDDGSQQPLTGA